jgi:peroxin-7
MLSANFASCQHHCFSAAFSPYPGDAGSQLLAVACAQYFGIAGNGSVVVFRVLPTGELVPIREFLTQDCAFDVAWSESNINQLTVGAGDGSVSLLDLTTPDTFPIRRYQEHTEEVSGVSWNMVSKQCFISSSWDGLIKLYNPAAPAALQTFDGHRCQVYTVQWHPQTDSIFASGDKKGRLFVWDARSLKPQFALNAASADVLTVDWNKWKEFETCTAGVDGCVRIWVCLPTIAYGFTFMGPCVQDLRNPSHPVHLSAISKLPIKRVRFCPHDSDLVATAG